MASPLVPVGQHNSGIGISKSANSGTKTLQHVLNKTASGAVLELVKLSCVGLNQITLNHV